MIILCNALLPNGRGRAILADICKIIEPTPVIERVTEVDVTAMITIESTDSKTLCKVL